MRAFPEGAAQKAAVIASVTAAIKAGGLHGGTEVTSATLLACVVEEDDPRAFETRTGIPGSLAFLGNLGIEAHDDPAEASAFAQAWIAAPELGADLTKVPSEMVLWVIDHAEKIWRSAFDGATPSSLGMVREMHARQFAGENPGRSEWSSVRNEALTKTDAVGDHRQRDLNKLAETLAWSPLSSRTILAEGVRILAGIAGAAAAARAPMSDEERAEIYRAMETLYAKTEAERDADPENYYFPDVFEKEMPEMSARFKVDLLAQNAAFADAIRSAGKHALALMRAVPSS
ncbi:hypothetical protein C8J46_10654 [Sphingomonas sp. PP-F2F-A104-K0414]|uniref:hypothetical protein n=1 Tax=Sphingomonas sp. PP-F2F-A104-K0414 TaxID=2135661 RepID=UPI001049F4A8|nr:hypothetical protein [Sphingomonas sp. PP-F2F-A104-K0414]TCP97432.1 hypothetical protein C8J46_10654 [Sphingomonas sp. PP-F2F-A104-K0414]